MLRGFMNNRHCLLTRVLPILIAFVAFVQFLLIGSLLKVYDIEDQEHEIRIYGVYNSGSDNEYLYANVKQPLHEDSYYKGYVHEQASSAFMHLPGIAHEHEDSQHKKDDLLLNVPFYIYEEFDYLGDSATFTIGGNSTTFREYIKLHVDERPYKMIIHDDEIKFYLAATKHPLRVHSPHQAKLFVVPILSSYMGFSAVYNSHDTQVCRNDICDRDLFFYLDQVLQNSTSFQQSQGSDHIITLSTFLLHHPYLNLDKRKLIPNVKKCNVIQFGEDGDDTKFPREPKRLAFKNFYVANKPCDKVPYERKTHDVAFVGTVIERGKPRYDRIKMCQWLNTTHISQGACGRATQCPTIANARLGFHVKGDSISANRLFDLLLSGTVPIFTHEKQLSVHQPFIDWNKLAYLVPIGDDNTNMGQTIFTQAINTILENDEEIKYKTEQVLANQDLFDWDTLIPFDVYMYMLQAHLWPETRVNSSKYSALILPSQNVSETVVDWNGHPLHGELTKFLNTNKFFNDTNSQ